MKKIKATITQLDITSFDLGAIPAAPPPIQSKPSEEVYTVAQFIDSLNELLMPIQVTVQGEINSVNVRGRAVYFTVSDREQEAVLNCFIWKARLDGMGITLTEGTEVKVTGSPSVFKRYGKLSFDARHIGLVGEGALKAAFEALKRRLEAGGFFEQSRKKPIPDYPLRIGLITSVDGAAKRDFLTHLGNYGYTIYFKDARVEGAYAIDTIVAAVRWFNENMPDLEVLVITRGGGSLESLQAFNSEAVAKAIFASQIPIISAVGHEVDVTIADMVADLRASTPTDAGKILSGHWAHAGSAVDQAGRQMMSSFANRLRGEHEKLYRIDRSFYAAVSRMLEKIRTVEMMFMANFSLTARKLKELTIRVSERETQLGSVAAVWYRGLVNICFLLNEKLSLSDPRLKLKQGYSIVRANGAILKSAQSVTIGDTVSITLNEGGITSQVTHTSDDNTKE